MNPSHNLSLPLSHTQVEAFLYEGASQGLYSAASLWLYRRGETLELRVGDYEWFDLASLTKPLVVGSLTLLALAEKKIRLKEGVEPYLPLPQLQGITWEMLLRHEAGLISFFPWYLRFPPKPTTYEEFLPVLFEQDLIAPPGTRTLYSDAGFILLGYLLEKIYGNKLSWLFAKKITEPLGITLLSYFPDPIKVAPTGYCPWRMRPLQGEPHDPHAYLLWGSSGHAGLFGTAQAVGTLAKAWLLGLKEGFLDVPVRWVRAFLKIPKDETRRPLSWDRPGPGPSQAGEQVPPGSVGHLGFTGTSLWISPRTQTIVVLLTNRTHTDPEGVRFRQFRPALHDLLWSL